MSEQDIIDLDDQIMKGNGNKKLPNATAVLVLGIISIVGAICYGIPGLICGIIAIMLGKKDKAMYAANPKLYSESDYKNLNAGWIMGIIGTSLSALILVIFILYFIFAIWLFSTAVDNSPLFDEAFREALENADNY